MPVSHRKSNTIFVALEVFIITTTSVSYPQSPFNNFLHTHVSRMTLGLLTFRGTTFPHAPFHIFRKHRMPGRRRKLRVQSRGYATHSPTLMTGPLLTTPFTLIFSA